MASLYPYFLTIHLICAIIFVGFLFTDVVLLSVLEKKFGTEMADKIKAAIVSRGVKIMPICVILLVLTGGAMITQYISREAGFFDSTLQKLLWLKVGLAGIIVFFVASSILSKFVFKKPLPFGRYIHPIALILGLSIAILAKLAFYL